MSRNLWNAFGGLGLSLVSRQRLDFASGGTGVSPVLASEHGQDARGTRSTPRDATLVLYAIVGLISCPLPAFAHDIHVSAHVHEGVIHGTAHYADDTPVRGATVTAFDPAGEEIGQTTTDEKGEFSLEAKFGCDHRLLIETADGHGGEHTIRATQLPSDLPPRGDAPVAAPSDEGAFEDIRHELVHLGERLDEYERRRRLGDILGGIGYILGIMGAAFYFLGVRRQQSRREG